MRGLLERAGPRRVDGSLPKCRRRAGRDRRHGERCVGSRAPRRHRRGREPRADRKGPRRRHRRHRPVPDRGSAARHLHRDVRAAGLQHVQARRHRADRLVHGDHQRGSQGRQPLGDGHRHRREPDRRRPERAAPDRGANEMLKAIPTVRSYNALVVVVPGVVTNTNDVATGTATTQFPIHGGRNNEGRMTVDGLNIGNPPGGNQPPGLLGRRRQLRGDLVHDLGRARRIGNRAAWS